MESHPSRSFKRKTGILISAAVSLAAIGVVQTAPALAAATTWWVSNQGLDGASCGTRAKPCRSISAAIEKAAPRDVVAVGAGLYGDLNGDGAFTAPGEEHYHVLPELPFNSGCIVCLNKPLKIVSLHGADTTIIDAGNSRRADPNESQGRVGAVVLLSSGSTFGTDGGGFTVTGGADTGVAVLSQTNVRIIGNIARGNAGAGFAVEVVDESFSGELPPLNEYRLDNNIAIGNGSGFTVTHDETHPIPELVRITGNIASGNKDVGFGLRGSGFQLQMIGNVSSNNAVGARVHGDSYEIRNNSIVGNTGTGLVLQGQLFGRRLRITGNSFTGNSGPGILLFLLDPTANTISGNNIYGNFGLSADFPPVGGSTLNCGIVNFGDPQQPPAEPTDVSKNYWGSPAGPGADPADNVGSGCDFNGSHTIAKPFATVPFSIQP